MPYSHITRTAFGADAIRYARGDGKGHNGAEVRNEYTAGVNMLPDSVVPFEQQMQPLWDKAHARHTTQVDRCIVSFHRDELNPDKPEDRLKGLAICCEIARRNAPDNQSAVFLQVDGKGGLIHGHIITNDVNLSDGKGIDPKAYAHWHFQKIVDEVCHQYFDEKQTELAPEKVNQAVRGARIKNEQIRAANALEQQQAKAEGRAVDASKIKQEKYIWQDDLRGRIKDAARGATSEADFAQRLRLSGVELVPHKAKDGTVTYLHPATKKQPAHYTYELTDVSGFSGVKVPQNLKSKSFKLGANYQPEGVAQLFQKQAQAQRVTWQAPAVTQRPAQAVQTPDPVPIPTYKPKPATATQKPKETAPQKSPEEIKKEQEKREMDRAKEAARAYIGPAYNAFMGWGDETPKVIENGQEWDDWEEAGRRMKQADKAWADFQKWRVDMRPVLKAQGKTLPPIYTKDKYGTVFVERDALLKQFNYFLKHPEIPQAQKQTPAPQQKPQQPAQRPQEQAQRPGKTTGKVQSQAAQTQPQERPRTPTEADRQRQQATARRAALLAELEQRTAAIDANARKQQQEQQDGWGGKYG